MTYFHRITSASRRTSGVSSLVGLALGGRGHGCEELLHDQADIGVLRVSVGAEAALFSSAHDLLRHYLGHFGSEDLFDDAKMVDEKTAFFGQTFIQDLVGLADASLLRPEKKLRMEVREKDKTTTIRCDYFVTGCIIDVI